MNDCVVLFTSHDSLYFDILFSSDSFFILAIASSVCSSHCTLHCGRNILGLSLWRFLPVPAWDSSGDSGFLPQSSICTFMLITESCVSEWHVNPAMSPGNLLAQFVFIGASLGEHGWALLHCNACASRHHPPNAGPVTVLWQAGLIYGCLSVHTLRSVTVLCRSAEGRWESTAHKSLY